MNFRWNMSNLLMEVDGNADCQNVLSELRTFIAGASRPSDANHSNLVKTAVSLLKSLPAAREAVLEYFGIIFHNYISKYLTLLEVMYILVIVIGYKIFCVKISFCCRTRRVLSPT